jgi:hypothetical protein
MMQITVADVKKNLGKDMIPGIYTIAEVMSEQSGYPVYPGKRPSRAKK